VIELSLVLVVVFVAFVCAAGLARWNSALALGGIEQGRILSAIGRTSDGFFWRTLRGALPTALGVALGVIVLRAVLGFAASLLAGGSDSAALPGWRTADALWAVGFVLVGVMGSALMAFLVVHSTLRVASRLLEATRDGFEHGLLVLLRGSGITALVADGIATLLVIVALVLHAGEFVKLASVPVSALKSAAFALPALALGALLTTWAFHTAGAIFGASAKLARNAVRTLHPELDDEHDPSLIANLAATHVGTVVSRTLGGFWLGLVGQVVALVLCASALLDRPGSAVAPLALLGLPLLTRVIGLLAAAIGILATRVDAAQDLGGALLRGLVATALVSVGGLGGACYWLLGIHWVVGFVPGVIGCLMGAGLGPVLIQHTKRRSEALSAEQLGQDTSPLSKLAISLEAGVLTVVLTAVAISAAHAVGSASPLPNGGLFALVMMLAGMGSISPFMLTLNVADPLIGNVQSISELRFAQLPNESQRSAQQLRRALFSPACSAQAFLVLLGTLTTVLLALCAVRFDPGDLGHTALGLPRVLWLGIVGAFLVLGSCGLLLHAIAGVTRATVRDMLGQLMARSEQAFTPNYKSTVDADSDATLARSHRLLLVAVLIPATVAAVVRMTASSDSTLATQSLLAFAIFAAVIALTVGLVLQALCVAQPDAVLLGSGQRFRAGSANAWESLSDDPGHEHDSHLSAMTQTNQALRSFSPAFAELGGDSVAPTLQLQAAAIAVTCLLFSPFLT
jgi:Na+/H+-translocating membrane pyrophosphatase